MKDLDIKKMLLEKLIGEMGEQTGKSFKKRPDAVVVEKHVTAVPVTSTESEEPEDDEEEEDEDAPHSFADIAKLKSAKGE